jgi:hypothetical protein
VNVAVTYQWRGNEPTPGQVYYVTGTRLRLEEEYDTAFLWRTTDQARDGLIPSSVDNDILIASEIANDSGDLQEWYTIQVRDADDDGIHTTADYKRAIQASTAEYLITDVVVLNKFDALGTAIQEVENANDQFNYPSSVRMLWVGMPANSPIGDENTEDSIIYTAKRTLQVSGNSPSHGSHVLIANTWATREIVLDDASTKTVTLDGSFIAAAAVGKQDGFTDIADTLLFKTLGGVFQTMETFTDAEEKALGDSNVTYLSETGTGIFRFKEDVTVDASDIDYLIISAMKQKHYVVRTLTTQLGLKLTGYVPPDPFAVLTLLRAYIAETIGNIISLGIIASYGSEEDPPTRRKINPEDDIQVFPGTVATDYFYRVWFNLRYPIKRTSGLFGVDSNAVLKGIVRT